MRPVVYFVACSLDGFIAGPNGEIDWLFTDGDFGYADFYKTVDTLVMGRKTLETALSFGAYPYPGKRAVVFSRKQTDCDVPEVELTSDDPAAVLNRLTGGPGEKIWLVGGAELAHTCLRQKLVDELILSVHPVTLGNGIPLFPSDQTRTGWHLDHTRTFERGLLQLTYSKIG